MTLPSDTNGAVPLSWWKCKCPEYNNHSVGAMKECGKCGEKEPAPLSAGEANRAQVQSASPVVQIQPPSAEEVYEYNLILECFLQDMKNELESDEKQAIRGTMKFCDAMQAKNAELEAKVKELENELQSIRHVASVTDEKWIVARIDRRFPHLTPPSPNGQ